MEDFDMLSSPQNNGGNGLGAEEEDPAAAFLAQQESEIAGIENDEGFSILDGGEIPPNIIDSNGIKHLKSSSNRYIYYLIRQYEFLIYN